MRPQSNSRFALFILPALVAALFAVLSAGAQAASPLSIEVLSSKADRISGGDALLAVTAPDSSAKSKMVVRLNGKVVTSSLASDPDNSLRKKGLVSGMWNGRNWITAWAPGQDSATRLSVFNSSLQGPVFSGPHQTPYYCTTESFGLGPAQDSNCVAPTRVSWYYRASDNTFKPLTSPADRPADMVQTTTRTGQLVDYVVRLEQGVINRAVYNFATLASGGQTGNGWNGRFVYQYGGGCSTGHQQGAGVPDPLDDGLLKRGFVVLNSSLNVFNTTCNDVISAETTSMIKERAIEELGRADTWTIGQGSSGGSVQIQMIAQNYPGLLDGLNPGASFPDNSSPDYPDCRLLVNYFNNTTTGQDLSNAQKRQITGMTSDTNGGCEPLSAGADVIRAQEGCNEDVVPVSVIFDPLSNPGGVRCTLWDNMINVYGADPATGYARRTLDNVGVQYGLGALTGGSINMKRFLDLNEQIGGYDNNGNFQAGRTVADQDALKTSYQTGRIQQGAGGWTQVPIIDVRNYQDDVAAGNVHQYVNTYRTRARLDRFNGNHDNQVMFRAIGGPSVKAMNDTAIDTLSTWLDSIVADDSSKSLAQKVVDNKPADAVDACWIAGNRVDGVAQAGDTNTCETTYPPHSLPVNVAGKPLDSITAKCTLKPVNPADYGSPTPEQITRLNQIFPDGVCDWSQAGPEETTVQGTDLSFGPSHEAGDANRHLGLKLNRYKLNYSRKGGSVTATATLGNCPAVTWQKVRFERQLRQGRKWVWKNIGSKMVTGKDCQASLTVRNIKGKTNLRARALAITGFKAANSKLRTVTVKKPKRHRR